jgi:hypothetical protein
MGEWTTPFMIGITQMISNSEIPPPSSGYSISFPNQPFVILYPLNYNIFLHHIINSSGFKSLFILLTIS